MKMASTVVISDLSTDRRNPDSVIAAMCLAGHEPVSARVEYPTGDVISLDYNTIEEAEAARLFCDGHKHNYRVMKAEHWNPQHKFQGAFQDLTNGQVHVSFKGPVGTVINEGLIAKHCIKAELQDSVQVFIHSLFKDQPRCEWKGIAFIYYHNDVPFAEYSEPRQFDKDGIEFDLKLSYKFLNSYDEHVLESPSTLTGVSTWSAQSSSLTAGTATIVNNFIAAPVPIPMLMLPSVAMPMLLCVFLVPIEILSPCMVGGQVCWLPPYFP